MRVSSGGAWADFPPEVAALDEDQRLILKLDADAVDGNAQGPCRLLVGSASANRSWAEQFLERGRLRRTLRRGRRKRDLA